METPRGVARRRPGKRDATGARGARKPGGCPERAGSPERPSPATSLESLPSDGMPSAATVVPSNRPAPPVVTVAPPAPAPDPTRR